MERTEPFLLPEWLNTKGGGSGSSMHHQDDGGHRSRLLQHSSEQDSSRHSTYIPPRRVNAFESKEAFAGGRYPNFSRSYRGDHHRGDWDADRDRERDSHRDRERPSSFLVNEAKDRENGRWSGAGRLDHEYPPRRPHSALGNSGRLAENGEKKPVTESSKLAGSVPKAAFERHFPSLGTQEKSVYSSLGSVPAVSPRHLWRTSAGAEGNSSSETRSSLLESNGVSATIAGGATKMADALVQNPPRVRTPPQVSTESQRLEELALKQSRQLVPMMPKPAPISRDKAKPKLTSVMPKAVQSPTSQTSSRTQAPLRVETPKSTQSKLHVLKPGVPIPETTSTAPVASSVAGFAPGRGSAGATPATAPRKPKQLLDRRAVPIPPLSASVGADANRARSSRESNGVVVAEDKRLQPHAQNRSDFYNAIRRKSAAGNKAEEAKVAEASSGSNGGARSGEAELGASEDEHVQDGESSTSGAEPSPPAVSEPSLVECPVFAPLPESSLAKMPPEEEAAFLKSLGWEEAADAEGGEGLTEEEINAFYQEHMRSMSSHSRLHNKLNAVFRSTGGLNGLSAGIGSSDSE